MTDIDPAVPRIHPRILTATLAIAIILTLVIGAVSFNSSFAVLTALAEEFGWPAGKEWHFPVIVDGTITATMLAVLALSQHTDRPTRIGRAFLRGLQYLAVSVSVGGNAFYAYQTQTEPWRSWIAAVIASIAPIFLLAMTEGVKILIRAPRNTRPATIPEQQQPEANVTAPSGPIPSQGWDQAAATELVSRTELMPTSDLKPTSDASTPANDSDDNQDTDPQPIPDHIAEFLARADLEPRVRQTAEIKLKYPTMSFEAIARLTGGATGSTAHRRWRRFEAAAESAGITTEQLTHDQLALAVAR